MSYCVNCGVELDRSLKECPLCNTVVINPNELNLEDVKSSFPSKKGQVEVVKRKDIGIFVSVFLIVTALSCAALNYFVYDGYPWSLLIVGVCVLLWVIMFPMIFYTKQTVYTSIFLDGVAISAYLYLISFLTESNAWFWELGLWIAVLATAVAELLTLCLRVLPKSVMSGLIYVVTAISVFCVGLEFLIDYHVYSRIFIRWSAIVLVICVILDGTMITLLSIRRLRDWVRRRFHF